MIGKLQASARQVCVRLSEGSILQVLENDLEAAGLCKAVICKFIREMESCWEAASLCKAGICKFIREMDPASA
jgi:hypothetical protein